VWDNIQVLFLLRCLDFAGEEGHCLRVLNVPAGNVIDLEARLVGRETLNTPQGPRECRRICLAPAATPEQRQFLLFDTGHGRRLVRLTNGPQVLDLEE